MFRNFFGGGVRCGDGEDGQPQRRNRLVMLIIIAAICVLAFSGIGGRSKTEKAEVKTAEEKYSLREYTAETEKHLCEALSAVKGAGDVRVAVSFESLNEKVLAKNSKSGLSADNDGEKSSNSSESEESVLVYGSASGEQPYVLKERLPVPSGVLVTASGAGDESVRLELYEAVKALYGISGHRIKVTEAASVKKQ